MKSTAQTLGSRLVLARRKGFVGRGPELGLFRSALAGDAPFNVLFVYGPGGVGKTSLLQQFAACAEDAGAHALYIDTRSVDVSPEGFLAGLAAALHVEPDADVLAWLNGQKRPVLLIDTYEGATALDGWLRHEFLPKLPARTLVAIAGRNPAPRAWMEEAGWRDLTRTVSLRNLSRNEGRTYLASRGIDVGRHAAVLSSTHGHPLALSLLADVIEQQPGTLDTDLGAHPNVVEALLERLLAQAPSQEHRLALQVCAHARVTPESLLESVIGGDEVPARELFDWLRGLSFIEQAPDGLYPHDLARDVLDLDVRWRNPETYRKTHSAIRSYTMSKVQDPNVLTRQKASLDRIFLQRYSPLMRPYFESQALLGLHIEPAATADHAAIVEMVGRHEGRESAAIAGFWLDRQPEGFRVARSDTNGIVGFNAHLSISSPTAAELETDPAVASIWSHVSRTAPLRPGEHLVIHRFWMNSDGYQSVLAQSLIAGACVPIWLTTPRLALSFPAGISEPDHWLPMFSFLNFSRVAEADYEVGGRRFGVYGHDWRAEPPLLWQAEIDRRDLGPAGAQVPHSSMSALLVLSEADFKEAVRRALQNFTRPGVLAHSPLLNSRVTGATPADAATLQTLLMEAIEVLNGNPRDAKLYRALRATYVQPAESQEAAAEALGLPFTTYRYHLARGIERITAWLWEREVGEPPAAFSTRT